jgi:UDP-3-O-acyl N-acetylglucosamine deacetylase
MNKQQTLCKTAEYSGIALHTGARARLRIMPAPENSGITFSRIDLPGAPEVKALACNVVDARRGTTIGNEKAVVYTIEHIMSALHAHNIDNARIEMDGLEPPIADGSAKSYIDMIAEAGIVEQNAPAKIFKAEKTFTVFAGNTRLVVAPCRPEHPDALEISCLASFPGCPFDPQFEEFVISPELYDSEIAPARTFVDYKDLSQLIAMGLCKGGSLDAAAILHNGAIICKDRLRFQDEIVRHKILDLVGDLFLCGARVHASVIAIKPGHLRNVEIAGQMLAAAANN